MAERSDRQNILDFQSLQLDFTAHVRNPSLNPIPASIEPRRMAIYARLIYNNIESFCAMRFRRAKAILGNDAWHETIRDFVHRHQSESPYFSQICEEFIAYLAEERSNLNDPPFLLELCHYEWLPLYLDRLVGEIPPYQPCENPLETKLQSSDLAMVRRYVWPVNKLSSNYKPSEPPSKPTWALAFRNRADKVDIKHIDAFTAHLIEKLRKPAHGADAVRAVLGEAMAINKTRWTSIAQRLDDLIELDVLILARST